MSSYDDAREAAAMAADDYFSGADRAYGEHVKCANAAIDAFLAKLSETHAVVPRDIVNPFAKVASREEMHASTIGHKDMPDTQTVALLMRMGNQEYMDRSLTLGDFRAMLAAMLSAQEVKG